MAWHSHKGGGPRKGRRVTQREPWTQHLARLAGLAGEYQPLGSRVFESPRRIDHEPPTATRVPRRRDVDPSTTVRGSSLFVIPMTVRIVGEQDPTIGGTLPPRRAGRLRRLPVGSPLLQREGSPPRTSPLDRFRPGQEPQPVQRPRARLR